MERFYKPIIAIATFYLVNSVILFFMKIMMVLYDPSFISVLLTGDYTKEQIDVMYSPTFRGVSGILADIVIIAFLYYATLSDKKRVFRYKKIPWKWIAVVALGNMLFLSLIENVFSEQVSQEELASYSIYGNNIFYVVFLSITGPLTEEMIFREGILGNLLRGGMSKWLAVAISAIIFAVMHFDAIKLVTCGVFGVIAGYVYLKTRSVLASGLVHIVNNSAYFIILALFGVHSDQLLYIGIGGYIALIVSFVVCIPCLYFGTKFLMKS